MAVKFISAILLALVVLEMSSTVFKTDAAAAKSGGSNKCNPTGNDADGWETFKKQQGKTYQNCSEENARRAIRASKLSVIAAHNADAAKGKHDFTLAENDLTDLTDDEYSQHLGFKSSGDNGKSRKKRQTYYTPLIYSNTISVTSLPVSVNWTATTGWVNPIQNQGNCGSCWSFSAAGAIEGQYKNFSKASVILSEQNLVDCTTVSPYYNYGCGGGDPTMAFLYVMNKGLQTSASYPYKAVRGTCKFLSTSSVVKLSGWYSIVQGSEAALQQAVAKLGPVSIAIDASGTAFQLYSSGVYTSTTCSATALNHAVLLVGYGTTAAGQQYWLIKNSWGTSWGIKGYMMLARNKSNMCGVASYGKVPIVSWTKTATG